MMLTGRDNPKQGLGRTVVRTQGCDVMGSDQDRAYVWRIFNTCVITDTVKRSLVKNACKIFKVERFDILVIIKN